MTDMDIDASSPTEKPQELSATSKEESVCPRIEIKKWNAVALWAWEMETGVCAICRNNTMELCIECQADQESKSTEDCGLAWGACNHAFHFHCISRWLKNRQTCPLDNTTWEYRKYGS
ncbi:RING-box protein hrt1 [Coemansia sp. BCRC 34490]|nr:RING-box protein hrt1 [Coemansia sp. BCRC 34490]